MLIVQKTSPDTANNVVNNVIIEEWLNYQYGIMLSSAEKYALV